MAIFYTDVRPRALLLIFVLFSALLSLTAWASSPTYGAEFEITRPGLGKFNFAKDDPSKSDEKKEQMRFVEHISQRCQSLGCTVVAVEGKWDKDYRVEYKDGWWFKVSYDPNCVEITFKPSTIEEMRRQADRINDHIFNTGKEVGLKVSKPNNSHFNMGINSAFNKEAKQFLKFFTDYANRPDLGLGSLGSDIYNAPPLAVLGEDQRQALQVIVEKVNAGELTTINQVAREIQSKVYTRSYYKPWGGIDHYQAIGLKYVNRTDLNTKDAPMEIRAMWIQDSAEQFIKISELIEGRIKYLSQSADPILYTATDKGDFRSSEKHTRFAVYVEEAGLNYQDFKELLPSDVTQSTIEDWARSEVAPQQRLKGLVANWDLVLVSEWTRKLLVDLLLHPDNRDTALATEVLGLIKQSRDAAMTSPPPKRPWHAAITGAKAPVLQTSGTARIYQDLLEDIEFKKQRPAISTPRVWGLGTGKMCGGVLF